MYSTVCIWLVAVLDLRPPNLPGTGSAESSADRGKEIVDIGAYYQGRAFQIYLDDFGVFGNEGKLSDPPERVEPGPKGKIRR